MLVEAISSNLEHLRPWVPWAIHEPESIDKKARRMKRWRSNFDLAQDFIYGIFTRDEREIVGSIGSHTGIGAGAREIGYWIRSADIRKGFATEAAAALTKVGFEIQGLRRIEIHCDPKNIASAGVARRLGYRHELTIQRCVANERAEPRDTAIWAIGRADYPASIAARAAIDAFDGVGRRLAWPETTRPSPRHGESPAETYPLPEEHYAPCPPLPLGEGLGVRAT
ncbi:MAG: GNAT family N-acetyltransferase [Phycisphaerales bacterium]|nr:GNAT family N-acetyltransferase [Phycisphaerales bacterium]